MDFAPNMPLLQYNDEWRRQRRWIQALLLDKVKLDSYHSIQQREVVRLLAGIFEAPNAFASLSVWHMLIIIIGMKVVSCSR